jgi:hypothetical protein
VNCYSVVTYLVILKRRHTLHVRVIFSFDSYLIVMLSYLCNNNIFFIKVRVIRLILVTCSSSIPFNYTTHNTKLL